MQKTIILADDDRSIALVLGQVLAEHGHKVQTAGNTREMMRYVEQGTGDVVITDVMMPGESGLDALPRLKQLRPDLPVIVISAQNTLMTAVRAAELGAFDYLPKPFDLNELLACVDKALALKPRKSTLSGSTEKNSSVQQQQESLPMVGRSSAMQQLYKTLSRLIGVDLTVLIEGESGTGKEVIARTLHQLGPRKSGPFVAVNMAAIPRDLVESELFGHEKGAFTGANNRKAGKFEQAQGGTLFLDEIGDMPLEAQTKLLRVLQQGEYTSVGGNRSVATDVRIVCATHRHLRDLVSKGAFREDLYYRLNVLPLRVPALRERSEDIAELCRYFVRKAQKNGLPLKEFDDNALRLLTQYHWPGNVRELENMVYRLCTLCIDATISAEIVREELHHISGDTGDSSINTTSLSLPDWVKRTVSLHMAQSSNHPAHNLYDTLLHQLEKPLLEEILTRTEGNQLKASEILGINRNTLRKKIAYLGIVPMKMIGSKAGESA